MITISFIRERCGEVSPNEPREVSVSEALTSLVIYELGYGGNITVIEETSLTVVTSIFQCNDTTTFSGSAEDMRPLVQLACVHLLVVSNDPVVDCVVNFICSRLSEQIRGRALIVTMLGPMFMGLSSVHQALVICCCADFSPNNTQKAVALSLEDLLAVYQLANEGSCSFSEALELA